ncbi:MAG TPA: hypothetical protein VHG90_14680 [Acidimicrobiales bacterium]|nr:hypothetical protein [Acidimicrobiales bacterium]
MRPPTDTAHIALRVVSGLLGLLLGVAVAPAVGAVTAVLVPILAGAHPFRPPAPVTVEGRSRGSAKRAR